MTINSAAYLKYFIMRAFSFLLLCTGWLTIFYTRQGFSHWKQCLRNTTGIEKLLLEDFMQYFYFFYCRYINYLIGKCVIHQPSL